MNFGPTRLEEAEGAILAHTMRLKGRVIKKGTALDAAGIAALRAEGHGSVIAARLARGDVPEDEAADRLAEAMRGSLLARSRAATGRVNLVAGAAGLLVLDVARLERINQMDESLTVATLPNYTPVSAKEMVATIKVIPFSSPGAVVALAETIAKGNRPPIAVHPFRPLKVGLVLTELPGIKESVMEGTTEATRDRVEALHGSLLPVRRTPHEEHAAAAALRALLKEGADMVLLIGASAVVDRRDTGPAAIIRAGGEIAH
ncbi:MAG: 4-diphosphocytidyl-2C-methyl-D-erythritol kinase, partial [Rhodospirillales bacterium]|nr:4-diphosphocytidyl-2C-methyl-D-erythritol kinase [Rhodospirillales bacterium]